MSSAPLSTRRRCRQMRTILRFLLLIDLPGWLHRVRSSRQAALLSVLAIATEKKLPLTPLLDAFADESRFGWRHGVRDLSDMLESGTSLPDALEAVPGVLPPEAVLAARIGAESGTLPAALKSAAEKLAPRQEPAISSPSGLVFYLIFLALVFAHITGFVLVYIIPKFRYIFDDIGLEVPPLTTVVIETSEFAVTYGLLFIPLLLIVVWVAVVYAVAAGRRAIPLTGPFSLLVWIVPRIATGDILRNLSFVVAAGRPLVGALSTIADSHPAALIRRRIAVVARTVEAGGDCWKAMTDVGLIGRREAALLAAAQRVGNLEWALHELARHVEDRISLRLNAIVEFARPVLLLAIGTTIAVIVVAMYLPLVQLIHQLS